MEKLSKKTMEEKKKRPPVVVVLGHVDHGKSSLLEAVKDVKIVEKEAGGITQHVGAYVVSHEGEDITFIDTPGHEAFSTVRSRGTEVADIAILVVAADEGVKEQTREAIEHIKKAEMPFLVAINKIDKKGVDSEKVKQDLSQEGIFLESYGGDIPFVSISAKKKTGIEELLEMILLIAQMEGIKKEKSGSAEGVVVEVHRDEKKGVVANLLVKKGSLKKGDIVVAGPSYGKIRTMENFLGEDVENAGESIPVHVTGLKGCPAAGDDFFVCEKLDEAKKMAGSMGKKKEIAREEQDKKSLNIIIKADVYGSLEAIKDTIKKIPQEEISIKIAREGIGNVSETDVECSKAFDAYIFAFCVKTEKSAERIALRDKVEIRHANVIYELVEEIREMAEHMLGEEIVRNEQGKVEILAVFRTQKNRQILGGKVEKGEALKSSLVEILRDGEKIGEGRLINVKKGEKDMEKIPEKEEFGMLLESKEKAQEGDELVLFTEEKRKKKL